jgi:hypothetical protein
MSRNLKMERALQALHDAQDVEGFGGRSHITDDGQVFRSDVGCCVEQLAYDFRSRRGRLQMPTLNSCRMYGCMALFLAIDKNVERIETFVGEKHDRTYMLIDGEWKSFLP